VSAVLVTLALTAAAWQTLATETRTARLRGRRRAADAAT
jgi:hypothetical protein